MTQPSPFPAPFMLRAMELAAEAAAAGEVPVGAVITRRGEIVGEGRNRTREMRDPSLHAEIVAIRQAALATGSERLEGCELWVTLEPCAMCAGAIVHARLAKLCYGAADPKGGAVEHGAHVFAAPNCLHVPEIFAGIEEARCAALLRDFFRARR